MPINLSSMLDEEEKTSGAINLSGMLPDAAPAARTPGRTPRAEENVPLWARAALAVDRVVSPAVSSGWEAAKHGPVELATGLKDVVTAPIPAEAVAAPNLPQAAAALAAQRARSLGRAGVGALMTAISPIAVPMSAGSVAAEQITREIAPETAEKPLLPPLVANTARAAMLSPEGLAAVMPNYDPTLTRAGREELNRPASVAETVGMVVGGALPFAPRAIRRTLPPRQRIVDAVAEPVLPEQPRALPPHLAMPPSPLAVKPADRMASDFAAGRRYPDAEGVVMDAIEQRRRTMPPRAERVSTSGEPLLLDAPRAPEGVVLDAQGRPIATEPLAPREQLRVENRTRLIDEGAAPEAPVVERPLLEGDLPRAADVAGARVDDVLAREAAPQIAAREAAIAAMPDAVPRVEAIAPSFAEPVQPSRSGIPRVSEGEWLARQAEREEVAAELRAQSPRLPGRPRSAPPSTEVSTLRTEPTKYGDQALIADTPTRMMPPGKSRATAPQADTAGALFERPGAVQAELGAPKAPEAAQRPTLTPEIEAALGELASELGVAEAGYRYRVRETADKGRQETWKGVKSSYPDWMGERTAKNRDRLLSEIQALVNDEAPMNPEARQRILDAAQRRAEDTAFRKEQEIRGQVYDEALKADPALTEEQLAALVAEKLKAAPETVAEALRGAKAEPWTGDMAATIDAGMRAAEGTPERARAMEMYDFLEEAVDAAGDIDTARRNLMALAEDAISETPGRRGQAVTLSKADQIALLDTVFPEGRIIRGGSDGGANPARESGAVRSGEGDGAAVPEDAGRRAREAQAGAADAAARGVTEPELTPPREAPPRSGAPADLPPASPSGGRGASGEAGFFRPFAGKREVAPGAPSIEAMAPAPKQTGLLDKIRSGKDDLITAQVNKFHPVEVELGKAGVPKDQIQGVMRTLELTQNKIGGQTQVFAHDLGKVYKDMVSGSGDRDLSKTWNSYLALKQAEKRIRDLSSRPDSEITPDGRTASGGYVNPQQLDLPKIRQEMADLKANVTPQEWAAVESGAQRVWDLNRSILEKAHDAGIVSDEAYQAITSKGNDYVPFMVLDYLAEAGEASVKSPSRPYSVRYQDFLKKMEGTERDVRNVVDSSMDKAARTIALINRNLAAQAVADLAPSFPKVIEKIAGDTFQVPGDKSVISVFDGGKRQNYAVPADLATAMTFLDAQQITFLGKIMNAAATPLRAGATGANLGFALVSNPMRDTAAAWRGSRMGWGPIDWVRGIGAVMFKGPDHPLIREALESGAISTFQRNVTPDMFIRRAAGLPKPPPKNAAVAVLNTPKEIAMWMIDHTVRASNIVEEGTKVGSYLRGKRQGMSGQDLAYETANYGGSPNFSRSGTIGPEMNLALMFYNARLQATARDIRRYREMPSTLGRRGVQMAMKTGAYVVVPTVAAWAAWEHYREEDEALGVQRPADYERKKAWLIPLPYTYQAGDGTPHRAYVKIAKDSPGQMFGNPIEAALDWWSARDPKSAKAVALEFLGDFSPVDVTVQGEDPSMTDVIRGVGSGVLSGANPAARIPLETGFNYKAHTQGPIVPRGLADNVLPEDQSRPTTSPTMIGLARVLAQAGLPEPFSNPMKLEYAITSGTGGVGTSVLDTVDRAQGKALPDTVGGYEKAARLPGLSRLLGRGGDAENRKAEERFYRVKDEAERIEGSLRLVGDKRPDADRARELVSDPARLVKAELAGDLRELSAQLSELREAQQHFTHSKDPALTPEGRKAAMAFLASERSKLLRAYEWLEQQTRGFTQPLPDAAATK